MNDLFDTSVLNINSDNESLGSDQLQTNDLDDFSHLDSYWDDLREQYSVSSVDPIYVKQLIDNGDDLKEAIKDYKIESLMRQID